jgi:hypothetical protein
MTEDNETPLSQCDVPPERRPALESYRGKRKVWLSWIDTDEHHAIWQTLSAMVWTDVSFRTLTQFAIDDEASCLGNSLVAEAIINGHVATQVLAIRRLVDGGSDVISLRRLIKDVRRNFNLFTRENYVCHDGLPYDYAVVQHNELLERVGSGAFWGHTSGPKAWGTSQMAHEQFDRLSGIASTNRNREDQLPLALIDTVEGWLNNSGADELAKWSHAYLAHAGTPQKREEVAHLLVTTNKITHAIKALARVTEAVSAYILFASGRLNGLMPTAQFDQFEKLDQPVMRADRVDQAHILWDKLSSESDSCLEDVGRDLTRTQAGA